jgi:hypothetical protein
MQRPQPDYFDAHRSLKLTLDATRQLGPLPRFIARSTTEITCNYQAVAAAPARLRRSCQSLRRTIAPICHLQV